jgi:hypothetical protein
MTLTDTELDQVLEATGQRLRVAADLRVDVRTVVRRGVVSALRGVPRQHLRLTLATGCAAVLAALASIAVVTSRPEESTREQVAVSQTSGPGSTAVQPSSGSSTSGVSTIAPQDAVLDATLRYELSYGAYRSKISPLFLTRVSYGNGPSESGSTECFDFQLERFCVSDVVSTRVHLFTESSSGALVVTNIDDAVTAVEVQSNAGSFRATPVDGLVFIAPTSTWDGLITVRFVGSDRSDVVERTINSDGTNDDDSTAPTGGSGTPFEYPDLAVERVTTRTDESLTTVAMLDPFGRFQALGDPVVRRFGRLDGTSGFAHPFATSTVIAGAKSDLDTGAPDGGASITVLTVNSSDVADAIAILDKWDAIEMLTVGELLPGVSAILVTTPNVASEERATAAAALRLNNSDDVLNPIVDPFSWRFGAGQQLWLSAGLVAHRLIGTARPHLGASDSNKTLLLALDDLGEAKASVSWPGWNLAAVEREAPFIGERIAARPRVQIDAELMVLRGPVSAVEFTLSNGQTVTATVDYVSAPFDVSIVFIEVPQGEPQYLTVSRVAKGP